MGKVVGHTVGRRTVRRSLIALLGALLLTTYPVSAGAQDQTDGPRLRFREVTFTPSDGERPALAAELTRNRADALPTDVYVVQFGGPIATSARAELAASGADVLSYIPDFGYRVRATGESIAAIETRPDVVYVDLFQPAFKLDPAIGSADDMGIYRVRISDGADLAAVRAAIRSGGIRVLSHSGSQVTVSADPDQLAALAQLVEVVWVSPLRFNETHNEYGAGVIMGSAAAESLGYDGSTQIVAVADTGLGDGTTSGAHRDIPSSRIVAIHDWPTSTVSGCYQATPDGAQDVDSGHGTHVSASVVSDGGPSGEGRGTAPAAGLVFQAVEDWIRTGGSCSASPDGYYLTGLPDDLSDLFQEAYDDGARIHSNSWGSDAAGDYTSDSATVDTFTWDNPDMLVTTSAGNAGIDGDSNGVVDDDSIGSPATAKNLLTVGASEGDRGGDWACDSNLAYTNANGDSCSSQGGANDIFTWGSAWPDDFGADPIASDLSAGNAEQMAAFSSRGPTDDGRIKPDVVAPGSWILSGYSDLYQEGYDTATNPQNGLFQYDGWGFPVDEHYKYMGGTSMSNPLTAGAAAVVRDFYEKADGHSASAALTKATIINSAVDMADENNDGADDNDYPIPNSHEGWGRVDVGAAVDGTAQYVDGDTASTETTTSYTFTVEAGTPLKVTLVWSDYPSDETAAVNLVNDLDLVVTSPGGGSSYLGNVFSGGWAASGGTADRVNNVENVYIEAPAAGTWTVDVTGFNVPFGPQPFALVVDAAFDGAPPVDNPPTVSVDSPVDGATVSDTVTVTATASDDNGVDQVEFVVDGTTIDTDTDGTDGWSTTWDTTTATDGTHTVEAVATDTIGQTDTDTITVTVDNVVTDDPPTVSVDSPVDGATVSDTVTVTATASDDNGVDQVEFVVDGTTIDTDTDGTDGWSTTWDTTTATDGTHTVEAVATDTIGQTDTDTITVTVDNDGGGTASTMHVGDLDGASVDDGNRWVPELTVTVHDDTESAVEGATVSVTMTASTRSFSYTCTTDAAGVCVIDGRAVPDSRVDLVSFTVDDVTHTTLSYSGSDNHDPDGDSDGTDITVAQ